MSEVNPYSLEQFCEALEHLISEEKDQTIFLGEAQVLLKKLLQNREFVVDTLDKMVADDAFLRGRIGTIDRHDILLYRSPQGSFSMRLFVWVSGLWHPIHDHGSWGIVGGYVNQTEEIEYCRLDDGSVDGYARIEEKARGMLNPGDTCFVLPFDDGIHWTGCAGDKTSLTVHVYGKPLRRGFVQCFNVQDNSVYPLITPKLEKRLHAVRALGALGSDSARASLERAFLDSHPMVRWESIIAMKQVDRDGWTKLLRQALDDPSEEVRKKARVALDGNRYGRLTMADQKEVVLEAMKKAGKPVKAGDVADTTGIEKKEVSKLIGELKKEGKVTSPKNCFYQPS